MADDAGIHLGFFSKVLKDDNAPLGLMGVDGREELSRGFSFDLLLLRLGPALDDDTLTKLLHDPCVIAFGLRKSDIVHGYLSHIEHVLGEKDQVNYYRATMVPISTVLGMGRRSAIYQDVTIPEMVENILTGHGLKKGGDFDIHVRNAAKSPKHEYITQYQESDWQFIQRWLEREGFRYWFEHTTDGCGLVIADANADATPIADPHGISFRARNNLGGDLSTIWSFHLHRERVPQRVTLVDYNYRRPQDLLVASEKVDDTGFGGVFYYGEHFKDNDVGGAWAKLRAEEQNVARKTVSGVTDCGRFRVGHTFELESHPVPAYDGKYLITSVEHAAGQPPGSITDDLEGAPVEARPYQARFTAMPFDVQFRPRQLTPWPRISGVMHAHIEADTAGDFAQIDDQGRYKVKMPFDVGKKKGLTSSRWIRMAQPYAGPGYGSHAPQHKGTEVLVVHIDGDPDRPIIVNAVPNVVTPGPVTGKNSTQSVMQTASGIRVELEDLQK